MTNTPRLTLARDLMATIQDALDAASLDKAHVTLDAEHVASGSRYGVVLVQPPALEFTTWELTEATFEILIVAGNATDYLNAWALIDPIIAALEAAQSIPLAKGEPASFQPTQGPPLPAYALTTHPIN